MSEAAELWEAFRDAVGFEPKRGSAEWKGWRTIIAGWAEQGFQPLDVRRMVRGFKQAHPLLPITPWKINEAPMAYISLVTPSDVTLRPVATLRTTDTHGVIESAGDVPPPGDLIEPFIGGVDES